MIKCLLKGTLSAIAIALLENYRHLSVQLLKIEAAKAYLHGVRTARMSAIGLVLMELVVVLIFVGLLLAHAGLFVLLPWTVKTKAVVALCLGLTYVVIGGVALRAAMSERTWMKKSGATGMLEDAVRTVK